MYLELDSTLLVVVDALRTETDYVHGSWPVRRKVSTSSGGTRPITRVAELGGDGRKAVRRWEKPPEYNLHPDGIEPGIGDTSRAAAANSKGRKRIVEGCNSSASG